MTIREAGRETVFTTLIPVSYRIGFNGNDETELDASNMDELETLWKTLCGEFEATENSVDYIW